MSIRTKAIVETLKVSLFASFAFFVYYFLMQLLGPKIGLLLIIASLVGVFVWATYDYYVNKFTWDEKLKD